MGSTDPKVFKSFRQPAFCRQSFATGARRYQAGEVYDGTDEVVAGNGQFFTSDIPAALGAVAAKEA